MSASVKAYFALKMIGDSSDAAHMRRAREAILARGGAVTATCSPAYCCRSMAFWVGAACRKCRSKSCCCHGGFRSICRKYRTGRALCWCRCWFCRHCARAQKSTWRHHRRTVCRTAASRSDPQRKLPISAGSGLRYFAASTSYSGLASGFFQKRCGSAPSIEPSPLSPSGLMAKMASALFFRRWPMRR